MITKGSKMKKLVLGLVVSGLVSTSLFGFARPHVPSNVSDTLNKWYKDSRAQYMLCSEKGKSVVIKKANIRLFYTSKSYYISNETGLEVFKIGSCSPAKMDR